jgi:hypothetical protein
MVDSLNGLGHNPVISSYNYYRYICCLGSPGPHGCKGLVPRSIQKGYLFTIMHDLVSAYVLGNPPCFTGSNVCFPDGIQK